MDYQKLLQYLFSIAMVSLILMGCTNASTGQNITPTSVLPTPTFTPVPPTATPTPALPTATPTLALPTATPTPAAGVGVPIAAVGWQVTIADVRHETKVSRSGLTKMPGGGLGISMSTTTSPDGFTFLIVETIVRNLNPLAQTEVSTGDVTVIDENGKSYHADDLSESPREFVFKIEETAIDHDFELHFRDVSPIPFSVKQETEHGYATEISGKPGLLPYICGVENLTSLGNTGRLTFYRSVETALTLGYVNPDGSNLTSLCSDIAFGDLQFAVDGGALLLVTPPQGWSSLYLIEPEGEIYTLVNNGLNIEAHFTPNGRWVLFATEKVEETGQELYSFDRETVTSTLVQAGEQINFRFLTDGRLITNYRETEESDRQNYIEVPGGKTLEPLKLPEEIASYASVSNNAQNLVYREVNVSFSGFGLFMSDLDGNNVQELAQSKGLRLGYALSPDDQVILMAIGEGESGNTVELRNLARNESWTIATGIDETDFSFSADSHWAGVVTTTGNQSTLYIIQTTDGSIRMIRDAVNAFFSPDSTQLAYTLRQPNSDMEMFVTTLDSDTGQSLGLGVITGWFPYGIRP